MNPLQQLPEVFLHIPPGMWQEFRKAMLDARQAREEVIGFLFCQSHQISKKRLRYLPVTWVVPSPDCYELQSETGIVLKQSFHQYILDTYLKHDKGKESQVRKLDVVHVHTHFGDAPPSFSAIDDRHEAEYAEFLAATYRHKPRLISGVFNELLEKSEFRIWDRKGIYHTAIEFYNSWFAPLNKVEESSTRERRFSLDLELENGGNAHQERGQMLEDNFMTTEYEIFPNSLVNDKESKQSQTKSIFSPEPQIISQRPSNTRNSPIPSEQTEAIFARQKVFGDTVQQQLGQLKVALIGCGGIGAVFAEQLARLGVKHWLLIDPDRLETVNLNRMPGATQQMVDQWWHKVHYVKWLIKRVYTIGSHVRALPNSVEDKSVHEEIATADLIVVATDNHKSRQVAQELAIQYTRPLVCLGTHIEVKPNSKPRLYSRVTVPPLGGSWCLMCANVINLQQAALESAPSEIMDLAEEAGYLDGVDDPAVYWLNSLCASTGVGVIHGMISGFLNLDAGLDWIYDFANSNWLKTNPEHLHTEDCYFCSVNVAISESEEVIDSAENFIFE